MRAVLAEMTSRCKFAKFVSDHVLGHVNWEEGLTVVHIDIETNEIRGNSRPARPSLDGFAVTGRLGLLDELPESGVNEKAFF